MGARHGEGWQETRPSARVETCALTLITRIRHRRCAIPAGYTRREPLISELQACDLCATASCDHEGTASHQHQLRTPAAPGGFRNKAAPEYHWIQPAPSRYLRAEHSPRLQLWLACSCSWWLPCCLGCPIAEAPHPLQAELGHFRVLEKRQRPNKLPRRRVVGGGKVQDFGLVRTWTWAWTMFGPR